MMMKFVGLGLVTLGVVTSSDQQVATTIEEVAAVEQDELNFDFDLSHLPTELSNFGSWKTHLSIHLDAALQVVEHEEVVAKSALRGLQEVDDDDKCKTCVDGAEKWILDYAVKTFEKMCASKPKCPFIKKMCKVYKKHPKVIKGFLFGKVNAHESGFSYCVGKKECDMPKFQSDISSVSDEDNMPMALNVLENFVEEDEAIGDQTYDSQSAVAVLDASPQPDCDCDTDPESPAELLDDTKPPKPKPHCDCICKSCIHHMTKFVLGMTIEKLRHLCHKPPSEKVKKMCKWAETHKEECLGFLFAKVEPWKGAMGFCAGNGRCLPGPHHHHHHHHRTTKAPPHSNIEELASIS